MRGLGILTMLMAGLLVLGVFAAMAGLTHIAVLGGGQSCMGLVGGKPGEEESRHSTPVQVSPVRNQSVDGDYRPWVKISVTEKTEQDQFSVAPPTTQQGILTLYTVPRGLDLRGMWEYRDQQGKGRKVELVGYFYDPNGLDTTTFHLETVAGDTFRCENNTGEERHSIDGRIDLHTGVISLPEWRHRWCTDEPLLEDSSEFRSRSCTGAVHSQTAPVD